MNHAIYRANRPDLPRTGRGLWTPGTGADARPLFGASRRRGPGCRPDRGGGAPARREDIKALRLMDEGGPAAEPLSPGTPPAGTRPVRVTPASQPPQASRPANAPDAFLRREPYPVNMSRTASPDPDGREPSPG